MSVQQNVKKKKERKKEKEKIEYEVRFDFAKYNDKSLGVINDLIYILFGLTWIKMFNNNSGRTKRTKKNVRMNQDILNKLLAINNT